MIAQDVWLPAVDVAQSCTFRDSVLVRVYAQSWLLPTDATGCIVCADVADACVKPAGCGILLAALQGDGLVDDLGPIIYGRVRPPLVPTGQEARELVTGFSVEHSDASRRNGRI